MMHEETLTYQFDYAECLKDAGQLEKARHMFEETLRGRDTTLGEAHPDAVACLDHIGIIYAMTEATEHAEDTFLKSLARRVTAHGEDALELQASLNNLVVFYTSQEDYVELHRHQETLLNIYVEAYGIDDEDAVAARYAMAKTLFKLDRDQEALDAFQITLQGEREIYGDDNPDLSMTYWQLAKGYRRLGRLTEAAEHHVRCWELEVLAEGAATSDTLETALAVVDDCLAAQMNDKAQEIISAALDAVNALATQSDDVVQLAARLVALQTPLTEAL